MNDATLEQARAAKQAARLAYAARAEVVGVGIIRVGAGYGVKINLRSAPRDVAQLPDEIEGVPVRFEVVGTIRPQ
jgi:hypothetical protein